MELRKAISARYSCRSYEDRPIDNSLLKDIIDTARQAPSASNRQEWRFVAVTDKDAIARITEKAGSQQWWAGAPVILACCAETDNHLMTCGQPCYPIDLAIIIDHITLLATDAGLGTCWVGAFNEDAVKEICGIPSEIRVVELLVMGYPADSAREKKRLELEDVLFLNQWKAPLS